MGDIQHTQMVLIAAMAIAAMGTAVLFLSSRWVGVWIGILAIVAALVLSYSPVLGSPLLGSFKTDLSRRILIASSAFGLIGAGLSLKRLPFWARLGFAVIGPSLLLWFVFANYPIERADLWLHHIGPNAAAILVAWLLIEPISVRSPGAASPLIIGCLTGAAAIALLTGTQQQASGIAPIIPATAAGALAAAMLASLLKWKLSFARGPVLLWLTLMGELYAFLWIDGDLPIAQLYWIGAIPLLAWIAEIPPIHRLTPWKRELIRLGLMIGPMVVVAVQVYHQMQQMEI
jgi:hypothetical protein